MKVRLSLKAKELRNVAGAFKGKSDPYAIVTHIDIGSGAEPHIVGKTEVVKNDLDPDWAESFVFDYDLGKPNHFIVSIYDEVRKGTDIKMGSAMFEIGSILGAKGNVNAKKMKNGGTIYARIDKYSGFGSFRLQFRAIKLKNTEGFMKKSDPFFEVHRREEASGVGSWNKVYRSKPVKDNLNPVWGDAVFDLGSLCDGDLSRPLLINVYDYEKDGNHVFMGSFQTTIQELISAKTERASGDISNVDVSKALELKKKDKATGQIVVLKAEVSHSEDDDIAGQMAGASIEDDAEPDEEEPEEEPEKEEPEPEPAAYVPPPPPEPTFVDYVSGGCELRLCVAIDFTGSNGNPMDPGTLHHIDPMSKNDYEKAILAIGEILQCYDSDKKFPVWGFGAKYGGIVRHCFQCGREREVDGVDGILNAYQGVFRSGLVMSGPTVFTEVIQTAAAQAITAQDALAENGGQCYTILLILTDGSVSDVEATAEVLDQVAHAPLSVVIVGVGDADFGGMEFLDERKSSGKPDIVNFVEFNAYNTNRQALTAATLDEIPTQLVNYFTSRDIKPLRTVQPTYDDIVIEAQDEDIDISFEPGEDDGDIVIGSDTTTAFRREGW